MYSMVERTTLVAELYKTLQSQLGLSLCTVRGDSGGVHCTALVDPGLQIKMLVPAAALAAGLLVAWGSLVDLADLATLLTTSPPANTSSPSIPCMLALCTRQTFACLTDRSCLAALACLVPCGSDQACTFHCITNHETKVFHDLNTCIIQDAECLVLGASGEGEECGGELQPLASLHLAALAGTWHVVLGSNPVYDCFPCQVFTFGWEQGRPVVAMDYQVVKDTGEVVDKRVVEYIEQREEARQGVLSLSGVQNGLHHEEEWRVVGRRGGWLVAEYCGSMTSWSYRGLVVLARAGGIPEDLPPWLASLGLDPQLLCSPQSRGCALLPPPPGIALVEPTA